MNSQTRDLIFASLLGGMGLLVCLSGGAWATVMATRLFRKEEA